MHLPHGAGNRIREVDKGSLSTPELCDVGITGGCFDECAGFFECIIEGIGGEHSRFDIWRNSNISAGHFRYKLSRIREFFMIPGKNITFSGAVRGVAGRKLKIAAGDIHAAGFGYKVQNFLVTVLG